MVFALAGDSTTTRLRANGDPLFIVGRSAERRSVAGRPPVLSRQEQPPVFPTTLHRAVHSPPRPAPQVDGVEVVGWGSGWFGKGGSPDGVASTTPPRRLERHRAQPSRATAAAAT